jgi:MFS family permease
MLRTKVNRFADYGALIYTRLGFGTLDVLLFLTGWTSCAFVFNIIAMTFVDRMPRNRLIALGFFVCTCSLIVEAALQAKYLKSSNKGALGAAVAMTYLYVVSYSLFLDGPTYFYIGEIWPTHLRAQGYSLGLGTLCLTQIIWGQAAPTAFAEIGWKYYIFFIIFAVLGCVVALLVFPNTLHKPLEETAAMFGDDEEVVIFQRCIEKENGSESISDDKAPIADSLEVENVATGK